MKSITKILSLSVLQGLVISSVAYMFYWFYGAIAYMIILTFSIAFYGAYFNYLFGKMGGIIK